LTARRRAAVARHLDHRDVRLADGERQVLEEDEIAPPFSSTNGSAQ
jgi:hypothetical protein